jgi:hypothetical protein
MTESLRLQGIYSVCQSTVVLVDAMDFSFESYYLVG